MKTHDKPTCFHLGFEEASIEPGRVCTLSSASVLWLLAWSSCGNPNGGSKCVSDSWQLLGLLSFYCVTLFSLDMRAFPLSYCILFCHVWLLPFGGLLFSEEKVSGSKSGAEKKLAEAGMSGERRKCGQDTVYERRIYSQFFKKESHLTVKTNYTHSCLYLNLLRNWAMPYL